MASQLKEALRRHLESSSDKSPSQIIESWQAENSIRIDSLAAALPLLDRVKVRRYDFYQSTAEILRDKMLSKIAELALSGRRSSYKRMAEMLEASFPYISVPSLRPIPMALLQHLSDILEMHKPAVRPKLKDKYLKSIVSSPELYASAPVPVKRYIWEEDPSLFVSEISPQLDAFASSRSVQALCESMASEPPALSVPSKVRRQQPVMTRLVQVIGSSSFLYEQVVACLREKYKCSGSPALCSLRMELLMALHDAKIDDVCVRDPLHKFAWVLDACSRDQSADPKRLSELRSYFKAAKSSGGQSTLTEIALVCSCPHVQTTLFLCLLAQVDQLIQSAQLPRSDSTCGFLLRLVQLGLDAWDLIRDKEPRQQHQRQAAVCQLVPCAARLRLESQLAALAKQTARLTPSSTSSDDEKKRAKAKKKKLKRQEELQDDEERVSALPLACAGSRLGRLLARYHCLHCLRELKTLTTSGAHAAEDSIESACNLLADLIEALAPLDEEFEPLTLQLLAVQLCDLRAASSATSSPIDRPLQRTFRLLLLPKAPKNLLYALLVSRCAVHLQSAEDQEAAQAAIKAAQASCDPDGLLQAPQKRLLARMRSVQERRLQKEPQSKLATA